MKIRKVLSIFSNVFLAAAAAIGLYALFRTYQLYQSLPPGACPIDPNRNLLYIAVGLSLLSLILSFFEPKKEKKTTGT